jgi:hypothetical protein
VVGVVRIVFFREKKLERQIVVALGGDWFEFGGGVFSIVIGYIVAVEDPEMFANRVEELDGGFGLLWCPIEWNDAEGEG